MRKFKIASCLMYFGAMFFMPVANAQAALGASSMPGTMTPPPAYANDPSKPQPQVSVVSAEPASNAQVSVSPESMSRWQGYDSPIRECIKGNMIVPSVGNDVFGFLFANDAQTNINMAILGFQKGRCAIDLTEGVNTLHCHFARHELQGLMDSIGRQAGFDRNGRLAQILSTACEGSVATSGQ